MTFVRPLDIGLLIALTLAAVGAFLTTEGTSGSRAEVYVENRKVAVFHLEGPLRVAEIKTRIGTVHIQHGEGTIRIQKSPCPQKICILQGAIRYTNDRIICVPARMTITVINGKSLPETANPIDAFTY